MKDFLTHIGAAAIAVALFYLLVYTPDIDKAYKRGLADCIKDTAYVVIPGKDSTETHDTSFTAVKPVQVEIKDSIITAISSFDTTFTSGKDTISITSTVVMNIDKKETSDIFENVVAKWFSKIVHKDFVEAPDTIKIYETKEVPVPADVEWYHTDVFAYCVSGVVYLITLITILVN